MPRDYLPVDLVRRVREAARHRCGYCLSPQRLVMARLEVDHRVRRRDAHGRGIAREWRAQVHVLVDVGAILAGVPSAREADGPGRAIVVSWIGRRRDAMIPPVPPTSREESMGRARTSRESPPS